MNSTYLYYFLLPWYACTGILATRWFYRYIRESLFYLSFGWFDWVMLAITGLTWPLSLIYLLLTDARNFWNTPIFGPNNGTPRWPLSR